MTAERHPAGAPDPSLYRLALYHCLMAERLKTEGPGKITSRQLADELDLSEETVRRDISFIGPTGRPGSGYETEKLHDVLAEYLGLTEECPVVVVSTAHMAAALDSIFPAEKYGMKPVAYFSEVPTDAGTEFDGVPIHPLTDIDEVVPDTDAMIAIVACSPDWVQIAVDQLSKAGVVSALILTAIVKVEHPQGMTITQLRIPCDLKSLAFRCKKAIDKEDDELDTMVSGRDVTPGHV